MANKKTISAASTIIVVAVLFLANPAAGGFFEKTRRDIIPDGYVMADIQRGGVLYDKWYIDGKVPAETHPLYPAGGTKSGAETWRCSTCHGWDYLGTQGIKGIYDARNKRPEDLFDHLHRGKEGRHDFSGYLSKDDIWALVKFIREGQVDIGTALDGQGRAIGDVAEGKKLYAEDCMGCHGENGNTIVAKRKEGCAGGVAYLAIAFPAESLHKIRWGEPGTDMVSMVTAKRLSFRKAVDILAYSQSLRDECTATSGAAPVAVSAPPRQTSPLDGNVAAAEAALSEAVGKLSVRMRNTDEQRGSRQVFPAFQIAQREFLVFRAANCRWQANNASADQDEKSKREKECIIRMTEDRTQELTDAVAGPQK